MKSSDQQISKTRKIYFLRLFARIIALILSFVVFAYDKDAFNVMKGLNFFKTPSVLHIMWIVWIWDMILQLIPVRAHISIGSQKQFSSLFRPIKEKVNYKSLKKHIRDTTASAYKVMIIWVILTLVIGVMYWRRLIDVSHIFLISVFFYVCDLICVLIWCPFRLIMKNKCCTTCRIFNWDHLMMFSPFIMVRGFYTWTLSGFAIIIWIVWELCVIIYPERFWENSNMALKCSECTDKLCTQYCRKLR